jgi:signal transduction histidine kinase
MRKSVVVKLLRVVVVLSCLLFPLVIFAYVAPASGRGTLWVQSEFYYVLLGATVGLAFIAFYFAYKEFQQSGKIAIHLISLSFLLFSLLLFGQSFLTHDVPPLLFDTFGTHARLVFALFFLAGVLASTEEGAFRFLRRLRPRDLNLLTGLIAFGAVLYVLLLRQGLDAATARVVREEVAAFNTALHMATVTLLAVAVLKLSAIYRRHENPMALVLALGAGFAIESALFFGMSTPWGLSWWLAHGVVLLGLLVLTYGIVLITHSREAGQMLFDLEFSRRELERARQEQMDLERRLENLHLVVSMADSLRHEILNPHTVISGNCHILGRTGLDQQQRELVEGIARQSQRVVELMDRYRSLREKVEFQSFEGGATVLIDLERSR